MVIVGMARHSVLHFVDEPAMRNTMLAVPQNGKAESV
jgi:hypothetical protein